MGNPIVDNLNLHLFIKWRDTWYLLFTESSDFFEDECPEKETALFCYEPSCSGETVVAVTRILPNSQV